MIKYMVKSEAWWYHGVIESVKDTHGGVVADIMFAFDGERDSKTLTKAGHGSLWRKATSDETKVRRSITYNQPVCLVFSFSRHNPQSTHVTYFTFSGGQTDGEGS